MNGRVSSNGKHGTRLLCTKRADDVGKCRRCPFTAHLRDGQLMGHTKTSLAFSLYSGGLTLENLRSAIDALGNVLEPEVLKAVEAVRS